MIPGLDESVWCIAAWTGVEKYQVLVNPLDLGKREGREYGRAGQQFHLHSDNDG